MWALTLLLLSTQVDVDFNAKATAVGPLLERLSAQTGAHLKAAPNLAQEILFVRVKGVRLEDLETRVAQALAARWKSDGEFKILTRTSADEKAIWNAHVTYRRKLVDEAMKVAANRLEPKFDARSLASGLAALGEGGDDLATQRRRYTNEAELFARGPMARLLDRLVLACNPNDLAAVGPFERRIFRVDPTRMQCGIDQKKYDDAIAAFAAEQQAWQDAAGRATFAEDPTGRMVSDPRAQLNIDPKLGPVSLEVKRGEMSALFMVNLTDEAAKPFGFGILSQTIYADPARTFLNAQVEPPAPDKNDPLVDLSDDSKAFQKRMAEAFGGRAVSPLSPRMHDLMLGVTRNDPLSWSVSDILSSYAETSNLNVVAALPESAFALALFIGNQGPMHVGGAMQALQDSGAFDLHKKDSWAMIAPMDRYEAALEFTPRAALAELMKSTFSNGRLDVRAYARYAFQSKLLNRGGIGEIFLAMVDRSVLGASDRTDWKSLQLYGSFTEAEARALEAGGRYPYALMSHEQRNIVERIVYAGRHSRMAAPAGVATEPTEAFALGVPTTCVVLATTQTTPVIVAYAKGTDGQTRPVRSLDPFNLATIESSIVGNPEKMASYGVANLAGYAPGAEKVVRIRVEITPGVWVESSITVPDYDVNATPVAWDKLPAPYAKQIADAMEAMRAQKSNQPTRAAPPGL